jgi:uncharacterized protein involved in exopolysaccharide biosynthesis
MANRHEIADVIFRRKTFILASTLLLLIAVTAAWQFSDGRYESQAVLLIRNNRAEVVVAPGQTNESSRLAGLNEGQIATEVQLL